MELRGQARQSVELVTDHYREIVQELDWLIDTSGVEGVEERQLHELWESATTGRNQAVKLLGKRPD
jgi:hypothetical protein